MKRTISGILVATLVLAAIPAWAGDNDNVSATPAPVSHAQFKASIDHGLAAIVNAPSEASPVQPARRGSETQSSRVLRAAQSGASSGSGGGHAGMIVGLISAVAGIAGTVYTLKYMKKVTDDAARQQAGQ
jgi:uncharacterized membrane protein